MGKVIKINAVKYVSNPEETLNVILVKVDTWAREAPPPTSLEEVRMFKEMISALTAVVRDKRNAEAGELDTMTEDELRAKARELGLV